ncbi:uncharacterized protein TM35_000061090, partial [Trypanosoma theileri]
ASKCHSCEQEEQQKTDCNRWERALHLVMMEATNRIEKKVEPNQHLLTSAERTMLRMAFKQVQGCSRQKNTPVPPPPLPPPPTTQKRPSEISNPLRRQQRQKQQQQSVRKEIGQA